VTAADGSIAFPITGTNDLYVFLESQSVFTPDSGETITVAIGVLQS
jgi:hypothetical protein